MRQTTRRLYLLPHAPDPQAIAEAAAVLRAAGLVAFPTETVYGLGANALDVAAVQRIFAAKARPAADPLIVHLADAADLPRVVAQVPPAAERLAHAFWPGPLTLILPRAAAVPTEVSAGRQTVAVRLPSHPVARALIRAAGTPIAAPSANRFGHTSPTTADHVLADLDGRIEMVLDAGPTPIGVESTVLDLTSETPTVLRPGGVSLADLAGILGTVALAERRAAEPTPEAEAGMISPGLLERHYAPTTDMWLYSGPPEQGRAWLAAQVQAHLAAGRRVGLLVCDEDAAAFATSGAALDLEPLGSEQAPEQIARRLYAALRALDSRRPDVILARDFGTSGLALAIADRLARAARQVTRPTSDDPTA
jgi:L-threonylcarbamoyladenylate synthase